MKDLALNADSGSDGRLSMRSKDIVRTVCSEMWEGLIRSFKNTLSSPIDADWKLKAVALAILNFSLIIVFLLLIE